MDLDRVAGDYDPGLIQVKGSHEWVFHHLLSVIIYMESAKEIYYDYVQQCRLTSCDSRITGVGSTISWSSKIVSGETPEAKADLLL